MSHVELVVGAPPEVEEVVTVALAACGTVGTWRPAPDRLHAYFRAPAEDLPRRFTEAWRETTGTPLPYAVQVGAVPATDWLAGWVQAARPIRATERLWIAPPGAEPPPLAKHERIVWIEPGLGFGTGSHPTTRALLTWIEAGSPFERVLDVGTGSGILALTALACGARWAVGLDTDELALANAGQNRARNEASHLGLIRGSLEAFRPTARFDLVVANLDGPMLHRLLPELAGRVTQGGRLGLAGVLSDEREAVIERAQGIGLRLVDERRDADPTFDAGWWSGWLARP